MNVVELIADPKDCAFDQPCKYARRVETYAIYCHNNEWEDGPRKCYRTFNKDFIFQDCHGFTPRKPLTHKEEK